MFIPFIIVRLSGTEAITEATLSVRLRDVEEEGEREQTLRLRWLPTSVPTERAPLQEREVTEFAACGVACVLVPLYAHLRIRQAAQVGDRFDYWVGDGEEEFGLEVSGTVAEDLERRHAEKVHQLLENPHEVNGYVAVTRFGTGEAIFSFHLYGEGEP